MDKNQIDLALRDACAHLLIPLNKYVFDDDDDNDKDMRMMMT